MSIASEQLFRLLVESVVDYAIFMLDPTGHVATWNAGAHRFKGYTADEIIGQHFSKFYPEVDVLAGKCELELGVAAQVGTFEDEGWRLRKDGTRFWANVVITAMRDETGTLIGFAKVTRDLTTRKRDEDARLAAEERFRLMVESVTDYAMVMLDPDGRVSTWNAGAERIEGYAAHDIVGRYFSCFYLAEDVRAGVCERQLVIAAEVGRWEHEGWRLRKDGTRFWANVAVCAVRNRAGELIGYAEVTRDLTERTRADEERAARTAAEHANRTKDEFLAILGHELRNPLAPIVTALELMKLRADPAASREHAVIERQVGHMMRLVDDLLDVSRIAHGKIELKRHEVDVRDVIAKALEIASPLIERHRHQLDVALADEPLLVDGDEGRLIQIVSNLVTNAAKYTDPNGRIAVRADRDGDRIAIEVRDNGAGIDAALLPHVFDLFVQGRQRVDRSVGGLGLGLTLVRALVELHGGEVTARSRGLGEGSRFVVTLPALVVARAGRAAGSAGRRFAAARYPRRVLVVDDNEDARELLGELLRAAGHDVRTAGDGPSALELVDGFAPEVAVLDIGLPVMDGYELAGRLRERLAGRGPLQLISLTGYGQPSDVARSREAGFDRHLVKPVDVHRLMAQLDETAQTLLVG